MLSPFLLSLSQNIHYTNRKLRGSKSIFTHPNERVLFKDAISVIARHGVWMCLFSASLCTSDAPSQYRSFLIVGIISTHAHSTKFEKIFFFKNTKYFLRVKQSASLSQCILFIYYFSWVMMEIIRTDYQILFIIFLFL